MELITWSQAWAKDLITLKMICHYTLRTRFVVRKNCGKHAQILSPCKCVTMYECNISNQMSHSHPKPMMHQELLQMKMFLFAKGQTDFFFCNLVLMSPDFQKLTHQKNAVSCHELKVYIQIVV